jgi:DNA-binding LacI/PurR family transcriptional regulator
MAQKKKRLTITALARELGLSVTTVSFVLNGQAKKYGLAAETVKRVKTAARDMNYVPNELARGLRQERTGIIGIVLPHLLNDWAHNIMNGVYEVFEKDGYVPFIINHRENRQHEQRQIERMLQRRADGFIVIPETGSEPAYRQILEQDIPLVFLSDALPSLPDVVYAAWDPEEVRIAVQHLIDTGCRKIVYAGANDPRTIASARLQVFKKTLRAAGLPVQPEWIVSDHGDKPLEEQLSELLKGPDNLCPDAVFGVYDDLATRSIDLLREMQIGIPAQVSVATLGDSRIVGPNCYDITTVSALIEEEGRQAARLMVKLLDKAAEPVEPVLVRGGKLIVRGSTKS